jgi:ABC-type transport system involved in multi-copper enzyme maturation permease subunit|tara:strand:+ start:570 stop:1193 length:624 start_codon:yes stop_codon:yes gene_type:complete
MFFIATIEYFFSTRSNSQINTGRHVFTILVSTLFVVITGVVTPVFAIESIQDERRNTNFDLLHLSRLSTVQILLGKLTGVLLASFALTLMTAPIFILSTYIGGFRLKDLLTCGILFLSANTLFVLISFSLALSLHENILSFSYGTVFAVIFLPLVAPKPIWWISPLAILIEIVKPESNPKVWLSVGGYFAVALLFFILINQRLAFKA